MQCEDARELVSALVDGEVFGPQERALSAHIGACPICTALADDYRRIGQQLASNYQSAPPDLVEKIRSSIAREAGIARVPRVSRSYDWRQLARQAAVLLCVAATSALVSWRLTMASADEDLLERDVVAAHMRSLVQEAPTQIASSEGHIVKPWFAGRVDFAPPLKDLAAEGFPLAGGRLDIVGEQRVATVVYKRRRHVINVFTWPTVGPDTPSPRALVSKGYNVVTWTTRGTTFWAISDLNAVELGQLQRLL